MITLSAEQAKLLDCIAIEEVGVPSVVLMENAGRSLADVVKAYVKRIERSFVCICCGIGNNAGDGFVAARHLLNSGIKVKIFLIGSSTGLKEDPNLNFRILKGLGYSVIELDTDSKRFFASLSRCLKKADVVVDAIFGIGLNRSISGHFKDVIDLINANRKRVVSADIPSGLDGTTGKVYGVCVKAHTTVTFNFAKKGLFKAEGPRYAGKVIVADIGIPATLRRRL